MATNTPYVAPANLRLFKEEHDKEINENYPTRAETTEEIGKLIQEQAVNDLVYKGEVQTFAELPQEGNKVGDVWIIAENLNKYFWNGTEWLTFGSTSEGGGSSWADITDKPETFPPSKHQHAYEDLTGVAAKAHTHGTFSSESAGFVPAPTASEDLSFLASDGTWQNPASIEPATIDSIWNE